MADLNYFLKLDQPLEDIGKEPEFCAHVPIAEGGYGPALHPGQSAVNRSRQEPKLGLRTCSLSRAGSFDTQTLNTHVPNSDARSG